MLSDLYETHYGIYNHLSGNKRRPLASVAMHPVEDVNEDSLLEETIRTYVSRGIKDIFNLNLVEFLELPIDVVEMLYKIANEEQAKRGTTLSDIEKQFKS